MCRLALPRSWSPLCSAAPIRLFPSRATRATGRLPKNVVPVHYAIQLEPNLESLTLAGLALVDIEVREPTARLVLNAVDMTLSAASIDNEALSASIVLDAATETAILTFQRPLTAGRHRLRIGFTARINKFGRGLFHVEYPTDRGRRRMIASHLEPSDARRVFPCWDEPAFKATFALTVTVPRSFLAVSNMPVAREEPVTPTWKQVSFQATPRMSSYLFVLVAGELERISEQTDGVTVSVVTTAGKRAQGRFALDLGGRSAALSQRLLRREVSASQARSDSGAGRHQRCHGELGRNHLLREPAAVRPCIERDHGAARDLFDPGA